MKRRKRGRTSIYDAPAPLAFIKKLIHFADEIARVGRSVRRVYHRELDPEFVGRGDIFFFIHSFLCGGGFCWDLGRLPVEPVVNT